MDIKNVAPTFSVAGQITHADMGEIAKAGFKTVICNRPDNEIEADQRAKYMADEAAKLGMVFVYNPISNSGMTLDNLTAQDAALATAPAPVLAYCRSGTRSITCWALMNAGKIATDKIVAVGDNAGYQLEKLRPQIEALAGQ